MATSFKIAHEGGETTVFPEMNWSVLMAFERRTGLSVLALAPKLFAAQTVNEGLRDMLGNVTTAAELLVASVEDQLPDGVKTLKTAKIVKGIPPGEMSAAMEGLVEAVVNFIQELNADRPEPGPETKS